MEMGYLSASVTHDSRPTAFAYQCVRERVAVCALPRLDFDLLYVRGARDAEHDEGTGVIATI